MSDAERMILSDAIDAGIEAEKDNIRLRRENSWLHGMNFLMLMMLIACLAKLIGAL